MIGTSDPYVKFHINNRPELGRTTVKEDATNPQWNETKFLLLTSLNDILSLEVMDKNAGRKDKSMGVANFDLKGLADDETKHEGLNLTILRNGKSAGELKVDMMYFPVAQPTKLEDGTLQPAPESNSGILRFTIHGCQDLDASKSLVGQYNPYTVLNVNGEEKWRTRRIKRTNNPSWEKSYEMLVIDKTQTNLTVDVKDDREFVDDPIVGTWSMPLLELFNNLEKKRDWFQLKNCSSGKIHVSATWKSVFLTGVGDKMGHGVTGGNECIGANYVGPSQKKKKKKKAKPIGVVRVKFHAARDLKNVEAVTGGKSDPYVRIMSGVQIRTRTEIIDNNLNPVWNEVHYVPVHSMKESLVLEVLDWNHMSKDKSLGATELDVRKLAKEVKESEGESGNMKIWYECMETIDKWAPLLSVDGKSSKGELHYEASFFPTLKLAREETKREQEEEIKGETPNTSIGVQNEDGIRRPPGIDIRGEAIKMAADGSVDLAAYESGVFAVTIHEAIFGKRVSVFAEILLDSNDAQFKTVLSKGTQLTFEETGDAFVKELDFSRVVIRLRHHREMEEDGIIGEWASKVKDLVREYAEQQVEELKRGGSATAAQGQWYQLQNSEISGKLRLSFQYTPVTKFKLDPSESMENQGNLVVTVLKASKVMAADRGGTSDPYIVLSLNGEKVHKTETVKKTLDPIFSNEQFTIPVPSRTGADFRFEIFDWNQVQQAKSLGGGIIPLGGDHVQSFVSVEKEFQITGVPGASGTLRLRLLWQPELLARKKTSTVLGGATRVLTSAPGAVLGGTKAMVGGGAHLAGEGVQLGGKILGGGLRASGSVLSSGIGLMSGKKKKNSSSDDIPAPLLVEGSVAIPNVSQPQQSISTEPVTTTSQPVHVSESQESDERNTARASVDIPESLPRGSIGDFNPNDATGVSGALVVTFMEAKGLKAADRGGTSDPFVRLRVGKKEVFKTQHIKKTLSPTWNESYTLSVTGSPLTLDIKVKDHNTFGGDVDLGEHELKLWELVHPVAGQMSTYDSWLPLSPSGSGEIRVKLEFTPGAEVDEADEGVQSSIGAAAPSCLRRQRQSTTTTSCHSTQLMRVTSTTASSLTPSRLPLEITTPAFLTHFSRYSFLRSASTDATALVPNTPPPPPVALLPPSVSSTPVSPLTATSASANTLGHLPPQNMPDVLHTRMHQRRLLRDFPTRRHSSNISAELRRAALQGIMTPPVGATAGSVGADSEIAVEDVEERTNANKRLVTEGQYQYSHALQGPVSDKYGYRMCYHKTRGQVTGARIHRSMHVSSMPFHVMRSSYLDPQTTMCSAGLNNYMPIKTITLGKEGLMFVSHDPIPEGLHSPIGTTTMNLIPNFFSSLFDLASPHLQQHPSLMTSRRAIMKNTLHAMAMKLMMDVNPRHSLEWREVPEVPILEPRSGKYVLIKLLRAEGDSENIDLQYIGFIGTNVLLLFAICCYMCKDGMRLSVLATPENIETSCVISQDTQVRGVLHMARCAEQNEAWTLNT
ncbi:hypothetical protein BC936DRAFT_139503 [Jimgerdemannia flammicorona]|uniref:C2 domain-containing protein n=1 Tax=Jimgerdemannia flammicorona TaxID=994334 RepID=A0A433DHN6_9FUNG|nr:hypothetical protein BC936DRAFT_139503 [Jimgerdemannia flammicorona]